jgi:hypothetical protein
VKILNLQGVHNLTKISDFPYSFRKVSGHSCHFNIAPPLIMKIYYQRGGSALSPSSTSSVFFEFFSLITSMHHFGFYINFPLSWFWPIDLTFKLPLMNPSWSCHKISTLVYFLGAKDHTLGLYFVANL